MQPPLSLPRQQFLVYLFPHKLVGRLILNRTKQGTVDYRMHKKPNTPPILLFTLAAAGTILVFIEIIMKILGSSLCSSYGCKTVSQYVRYGDITILLLGGGLFLLLSILSRPGSQRNSAFRDKLISTILCTAIASEGFLIGYQLFRLQTPCWFCLFVAAIFLLMGIVWMCSGRWEVVTGFGGCFAILILFYLILPVHSGESLGDHIDNSTLTLFYSSSCESCTEIEALCIEGNIVITKVDADEHFDLLTGLSIYEIPVLFINGTEEKRVLIGKEKIKEFLETQN